MASTQFFHIETYSRKVSNIASKKGNRRSVRQIVNEAIRLDGFCSHIREPEAAKLIFGLPLEGLPSRREYYLDEQASHDPQDTKTGHPSRPFC